MYPPPPTRVRAGFTLVELLVVITIIIILAGLLFPAMSGVSDTTRKLKAKNDLTQIVNATKAYYTEYGKYPLVASEQGSDTIFGEIKPFTSNLMDVLRANGIERDSAAKDNLNPRRVVFVEWPAAKDSKNPKNGISSQDGQPYDPWGKPYIIKIDGNYDNSVNNPYKPNTGAGFDPIGAGVIGWSAGKDKIFGADKSDKSAGDAKDDIISWL